MQTGQGDTATCGPRGGRPSRQGRPQVPGEGPGEPQDCGVVWNQAGNHPQGGGRKSFYLLTYMFNQ